MRITIVVAMTWPWRVIGNSKNQGGLPWGPKDLPTDMAHFRRVTMGKPMIMGWNTFDVIYRATGGLLPGREHIVITRGHGVEVSERGATAAHSPTHALEIMRGPSAGQEVTVIGGADIYAEFLCHAGRLIITKVHAKLEGDTYFPTIERGRRWMFNKGLSSPSPSLRGKDKYPTSLVVWDSRTQTKTASS